MVGGPERVAEGLAALVERTGADELMLGARLHDIEHRARSVTLAAGAMGLPARVASG